MSKREFFSSYPATMGKVQLSRQAIFIVSSAALIQSLSGCVTDPDCGVCDPNSLILETISGVNYAGKKIYDVGPECEGPACPSEQKVNAKYFVTDIKRCLDSEEANDKLIAPRGPEEWCKLSPLISDSGIEFVFNNSLEPTSVELVRKFPRNPALFEPYRSRTNVLSIEGPITRYNGDYRPGMGSNAHVMKRIFNLTCIENLRDQDIIVTDAEIKAAEAEGRTICDDLYTAKGAGRIPLRMQARARDEKDNATDERPDVFSYQAETDPRLGECVSPSDSADTCCNVCDFEQGVNVYKYGATDSGDRVTFENATPCDPAGDVFAECRDFKPFVERGWETRKYLYDWNGDGKETEHVIPFFDRLREVHPADRKPEHEANAVAFCTADGGECSEDNGLDGTTCMGTDGNGNVCIDGDDCTNMRCRPEWFGTCLADAKTTGMQGYCVDKRFRQKSAAACYEVGGSKVEGCDPETNKCQSLKQGSRLANCDVNLDGTQSAEECCPNGEPCDPLFLKGVEPIGRFDRDSNLVDQVRECFCGEVSDHPERLRKTCDEQIKNFCDGRKDGVYTTRFLTRAGGVVLDPALKGVKFYPADIGGTPRARVEICAEQNNNIGGLGFQDAWRSAGRPTQTQVFRETDEDFDRGLCSGSEYRVVFASSDQDEHVRDKANNTLDGKNTYRFSTPEFHVEPNSGFPTDNVQIGPCHKFEIEFSNKFDMDPLNLNKLQIWSLREVEDNKDECDFGDPAKSSIVRSNPNCWVPHKRVAGGVGCTEISEEVNDQTPPCLSPDIRDQMIGKVRFSIDVARFGAVLSAPESGHSGRYRMVVPGIGFDPTTGINRSNSPKSYSDFAEDIEGNGGIEAYRNAFHDICGMPIITAGAEDFHYDFSIDPPMCGTDQDRDDKESSCDNSEDLPNPDQANFDGDQFGDIEDICVVTQQPTNQSDSDKDGIGNDCDRCPELPSKYNEDGESILDVLGMWVRNAPTQLDYDKDGVGDVCDNCPADPNCGPWGTGQPSGAAGVNSAVDRDDPAKCQTDNSMPLKVGDSCENAELLAGAAGPRGFGMTDDFDQDGILNPADNCPRIPIPDSERITCDSDADCPEFRLCENQVCNHRDVDGDSFGDICDTCPFVSNPMQGADAGAQMDDKDGDFVGDKCEGQNECQSNPKPRPHGFYRVSVGGACCVTRPAPFIEGFYTGVTKMDEDGNVVHECKGNCDPDGIPIMHTENCPKENEPEKAQDRFPDGKQCRRLPIEVEMEPGRFVLPEGCEEALAVAGLCDPGDPNCTEKMPANRRLTREDFSDPDELWENMCFLPPWDLDYDGYANSCDKCIHAFDKSNEPYRDANGKVWPGAGHYCNGKYNPRDLCPDEEEVEDTDGDETGDSDTGGEEETDGV